MLTMRPDGRLAGPGPADITGMVQTGIQFGTRTWSDGRTEPISRPVYEKLTRRCNVGELALAGASPPLGSLSTAPATLLNTVFGVGISLLLVRNEFPGKRILSAVLDLPRVAALAKGRLPSTSRTTSTPASRSMIVVRPLEPVAMATLR